MLFKLMTLVHVCAAFSLKCPEPAQWRLRANGHCADPSKYFCLRNDLINGYSENCTRFDFQQAGRKSVLRGGIDAVVCSRERYQPSQYIFYTNASTNCILLKSFCNEEGQVVYDHGNRTTDATCTCDYRRGYAFLIKPNNPCFCKPAQEDCSCFLKICSNSSHILSTDYKCTIKSDLPPVTHCRAISNENDNNGRRPDITETFPTEDNFSFFSKYVTVQWRKRSAIAVSSIFGCTIVIFLVLCINGLRGYCFRAIFTSEFNPISCMEGEKLQLKCSVYSNDVKVKWMKDDMEIEQNENLSIYSYGKDHFLTVQQAKLSDSGQYVMTAENVQKQQTVTVKGKTELEKALQESESSQSKALFNWTLLKEILAFFDIEDVSKQIGGKDLWDGIKHNSRRSQLNSILSTAIYNIQTSADYDKFEATMSNFNPNFRFQTPNWMSCPVYTGKENHLIQGNRKFIENEMYPKDHIDSFLEGLIFSLKDHEELRTLENVRQRMAHSFLKKIQLPPYIMNGSMTRLIVCFKRDDNQILNRISELMDKSSLNGNLNLTDDKNLQELTKTRNICRHSVLCKWTYLKENFNPPDIIVNLFRCGLVDEDRADVIRKKPRREMVDLTLRNIVRRIDGEIMLSKLKDILKEVNLSLTNEQQDIAVRNRFGEENICDGENVTSRLQILEKDLEREFDPNYIDTFLEHKVFDIDDHEIILEAATAERAKCFYEKISDIEYIKKGSIKCLAYCLETSKDRPKIRQILAGLLTSNEMPEQEKKRTEIDIEISTEIIFSRNTNTVTQASMTIGTDPKIENDIFNTENSPENINKTIPGQMEITGIKRSSVIFHLQSSDGGNVKLVFEKSIMNGNLTSFIKNLLDDENVKKHMSPGKRYNLSVTIHSKDQQKQLYSEDKPKMRIIKANRKLLEEEYDPMSLLKAVFDGNQGNYKSIASLSPEDVADFKQKFSEINKIPERRKRVKQFLNIAEDMIEADKLWELIEDTANTFSMMKMRDDLNAGQNDISSSDEGLVFEGKYLVWKTEKDVKSPLQSFILEESKKKGHQHEDTMSYKDLKSSEEIYLPAMKNADEERQTSQNIGKDHEHSMLIISQEEENYVRMSLLLSGISLRAVRALFDSEFTPSCLDVSIRKASIKLRDLKHKRIINQSQWNLLFVYNGCPDSKTFDVPLMITLLTNLAPFYHYDKLPLITDTTTSADLARIKYYRNYISNNKDGKIDNSLFSTAWDDIIEAVGRLGGKYMLDECKELRASTLGQSTVPWNIRVHIDQILAAWKSNILNFVETRSAKHVLKCVQENSCVTITASFGVGKTATLRHVALQMADKGYDVLLVTNPYDIIKFHDPNKKTLFVMDDFCGTYSINQSDLNSFESVMKRLQSMIQKKITKLIVACRLQVFRDYKFQSLSIFRTCVCNLQSEHLCLSQTEKHSIAKLYLEKKNLEIIQFCNLYDCFPLLCKLYNENQKLNITDFFKFPFLVYEAEIDNLQIRCFSGKYCALALCVMFNNSLKEKWFTDEIDTVTQRMIENTCEACRLEKGTSRLVLLDELRSLEHTFFKKELNVYKTIDTNIFNILAFYFGKIMIQLLISYGDSELFMQRLLLERKDDMDRFITIVPHEYHQMHMNRMIDDWSKGRIHCVFNNINMKIPEFRLRFLYHLNTLDISFQIELALTCDVDEKDTVLLRCCQYDDIPLIQWSVNHGIDVNQCNCKGVCPLYVSAKEGHTKIVKLLLDNNANINKCTDAGASPLFVACQKNHKEIVKLLLDKKADIDKCMNDGTSPLFIAKKMNHIDIVRILVEKGALV